MPKLLSRKAVQVRSSLMTYLAPKLALDAQWPNLRQLVDGITNKNFAAKRADLLAGVTKAVDGKLKLGTDGKVAKDAELDHLPELLEALEREEEEEAGDSELDGGKEERLGMLPGLDAGREFLQGKLSAEDLKTYDEMCTGMKAHDETPEEKAEREEEEKKAKDKKARDEAGDKEREEEDRKSAMDAAIKGAIGAERDRQAAIREAEKAFRPHLGELSIAFDSAESIYQHGLKAMGVTTKLDGLPLNALKAILESQPNPGAPPRKDHVAMDGAASKSFSEMFGTTHMPNII